jgi:hypothetical protein
MEWLRGHHMEVLLAQVSKACAGEQATSNSIRMGSVTERPVPSCPLAGVLGQQPEPGRGFPPDILQVLAHRGDALVVEPVEAPGAFGPIGNQPGLLE